MPAGRHQTQTGAAGAFLVAAELSLRGWPASVTFGNTKRTDLLAQVGDHLLPVAVQVKTKGEKSRDFRLASLTQLSPSGANEWVVLVALHADARADFFVVPRDHVVASVVAVMHALPKNSWGALGPQEFAGYQDAWSLMERPARAAKWSVQPWVLDVLEEMERPQRP